MSAVSGAPATTAAAALVDVRAPAEHEAGSRSHLLRWLARIGDTVALDEPLLEIETDKVTVEIAAPAAGVLAEILKAEQEEIAPGELLARIEAEGAAAPATAAGDSAVRVPDGSPPVENVGTVTSAGNARAVTPADVSSARARSLLSPAVKRLIAELAVDPSAIRGTGAGGRLTVDDVLRYASERRTERATGEAGNPAGRRIPHSPTRRRIAEHMVRSLLHTAPHVTTVFEADYAAVLAHRARNREALASRGTTLTLTAYIVAACVDAIRAVPEANARWTDDALEIVDSIDIGVAAAVEGKGLIVPVVHDAPALDVAGVASELGRLAALARSDRLTPADVRGGTFTVSNHGVSGSLIAAPIVINQPQVAILGVGKVESRPVVIEDAEGQRIAARPRGYLTLTIDHRVMDGHRANRFLEVLVDRLERWPLE